MTETTERFLQEIAARVGYDRVAELYLFPVLRQGGVEGAVAVVAAHPEPAAADAAAGEAAVDEAVAEGAIDTGNASSAIEEADEPSTLEEPSDVATGEIAEPAAATESESSAQHPERARHVVYTARYRHTIKGTDRGRWLVEVVAEADAPLITVEEVVRGVVRRSGDAFQPERISGDQFRAIVPAPAVPGSAPA